MEWIGRLLSVLLARRHGSELDDTIADRLDRLARDTGLRGLRPVGLFKRSR